MTQLHGLIGMVAFFGAMLFVAIAAVMTRLSRGHVWLDRLVRLFEALLVVQVAIGALVYLSGVRPAEGIHLLYGLVILAALPLASSFASDAPPRPRSAVLTVGGLVVLLLAWRLLSTG